MTSCELHILSVAEISNHMQLLTRIAIFPDYYLQSISVSDVDVDHIASLHFIHKSSPEKLTHSVLILPLFLLISLGKNINDPDKIICSEDLQVWWSFNQKSDADLYENHFLLRTPQIRIPFKCKV